MADTTTRPQANPAAEHAPLRLPVGNSLYPRESCTREVRCLDGMWDFRRDETNCGIEGRWFAGKLSGASPMVVPASFNELVQNEALRNHIGLVWYERTIHVPASWKGQRIFLRFGAVWHRCHVWLNGVEITRHSGGFLPFEADLSRDVIWDETNRITVAVDNRLDYHGIPHGFVIPQDAENPSPANLHIHGDVFPYAGIHRSVFLCKSNRTRLAGVRTWTQKQANDARLHVNAIVEGGPFTHVEVELLDANGQPVALLETGEDAIRIPNARFWFPGAPYLYTLALRVFHADRLIDSYALPVGLRTVSVRDGAFLINDTIFQFRGFGKTEDNELRGRGWDAASDIKDFSLLGWIGANSFRTAHHPFAEETLHLADRLGIAIIEEAPALSIWIPESGPARNTGEARELNGIASRHPVDGVDHSQIYENTLQDHLRQMEAMIGRDMNSPSVVMWSLGNEVDTTTEASRNYFRKVADHTRSLDPSRPITKVECFPADESRITDLVDVISVNRYYGWYSECGQLDVAVAKLEKDLTRWHERTGKPVFLTEFGAEAIAGLHQDPPVMFSEEYQAALIERYLDVCARLPFVIGAHVWTFTDFMTKQGVSRVDGNKKGVFTRDRRPKMAAHLLRKRWAENPI